MPAQVKFGIINAKLNQIEHSANLVENDEDDYAFLSQIENIALLSVPEDSGSALTTVQDIPKTTRRVCTKRKSFKKDTGRGVLFLGDFLLLEGVCWIYQVQAQ